MAGTSVDTRLLAAALADTVGDVTIQAISRLSGGASRETWAFDAVAADGSVTELVLRRDPPGRPSEPGATGREAQAISSAGMIMRRVHGETIARRILRDDRYRQARDVLVGQVASFAAGLHALPLPAGLPAADPLTDLRARLDELGADGQIQPSEVFERAFDELARNRPARREPVTVHGHLRLGNLIVDERGLAAVIDWELVHAGEPAEDLGWLCVRAWRFGGQGAAAGLGSREQLLAAYRAAGGAEISADELRWWETLGTLRWGVICMAQAWVHLSGAYRSVELAAIGRRVCEQEWDLLTLLEPEAAARAAARRPRPSADPRRSPAPHGRPTASELLDAVRGYLTDQVMPGTSGQLAF